MEETKLMPEFITKKVADLPPKAEKRRKILTWKTKLKLVVVALIVLMGLFFWGAYQVDKYFETHNLRFQTPIQTPIIIEKREAKATIHLVAEALAKEEAKPDPLSPIERMICNRFGEDCILALAVSNAENGTRECDRISPPNKDGSIDIGLWQLNSYNHLQPKGKHKLADLINCEYNNQVAFEVYTSRDKTFDRWVAYNQAKYVKAFNHYVSLLK